jgi:hypothetical protein
VAGGRLPDHLRSAAGAMAAMAPRYDLAVNAKSGAQQAGAVRF